MNRIFFVYSKRPILVFIRPSIKMLQVISSKQFWEAINTYTCISPTCTSLTDLWDLRSSFWRTKPDPKASSWLEDHKDTHWFTSIKPMGLIYRLLYYMVLSFPAGHETQSDDGSEKSDGLRKIALNGRRHGNLFFNKRKSHHGRLRIRKELTTWQLTGDQSANK